jgi:hypothetical protein
VVLALSLAACGLAAFGLAAIAAGSARGWDSWKVVVLLHLLVAGVWIPMALASAAQMAGAVLSSSSQPLAWAWLAPVSWVVGVFLSWAMAHPSPWLPAWGVADMACTVGVGAGVARAATGSRAPLFLRVGLPMGLAGLAVAEGRGAALAGGLTGVMPGMGALPPHVALAVGTAFLPLLVVTSGQLFPMFAHVGADRRPWWRLGLAAALWVCGASGALWWSSGWVPRVAVTVGGLGTWAYLVEQQLALRAARWNFARPDPAAIGAWMATWCLAMGAMGVGWAAWGRTSPGLWAAALALTLVGGVGGSIVGYARRILPFSWWTLLRRQRGKDFRLPKLEHMRPRWSVWWVPAAWAAGSLYAAAGMAWRLPANLLPLGAGALLAAVELLWAVGVGVRHVWAGRLR